MKRQALLGLAAVLVAGCREEAQPKPAAPDDPWAVKPGALRRRNPSVAQDYADARRSFRTQLVRKEPSPQWSEPVTVRPDAVEVEFESGGLKLKAWISKPGKTNGLRAPAVVFLHGGFAFGDEDWDMSKPFRDAGFVVLAPILRGENGSPGAFSLFYDEVDDVLAATELLATRPEVDASRIFVTGHSAGGVLAMLSAMTSKRFRAMTSLSGVPDTSVMGGEQALVPFDANDENEFRMRSALAFPTSFKCPARLFLGNEESWLEPDTRDLAQRARASGQDVDLVIVPGDHSSMTGPGVAKTIEFFAQQR